MSYRKRILGVLKKLRDDAGPSAYGMLDPKDILGKPGDIKYQHAVNQLLQEKFILATRTSSDGMAFRLNPEMSEQIERELQPWYLNTNAQWLIGILLTIILAITFS